jgi:CRISPR/Cas system CSM-associated protein Csm3 (group 7 of RAMP superfamily)
VALIPEEPLLVQAPVPRIPDPDAPLFGRGRTSDAEFVTALVASPDTNGHVREHPYIPGSSLKGVLRTRAEKIVRTLTFCQGAADTTTDEGYTSAQTGYVKKLCACAITHSEEDSRFREPERLLACFGTPDKQRGAQQKAREMSETTFARELYDKSCVTCRLFGNTMMQGRLHVSDATLTGEPETKLFDHVAIDRFHGGAADQQKFDTRPLMPTASSNIDTADPVCPPVFQPVFKLRLHLGRFEPWMLGLLGHLLKDLITADIRFGHATHRGYGRIRGVITESELLVFPNSELESLCLKQGILPQDPTRRLGPYWQVDLKLPLLFDAKQWGPQGLRGEILETPAAELLLQCDQIFRELISQEQKKPHGSF